MMLSVCLHVARVLLLAATRSRSDAGTPGKRLSQMCIPP